MGCFDPILDLFFILPKQSMVTASTSFMLKTITKLLLIVPNGVHMKLKTANDSPIITNQQQVSVCIYIYV